MGKGKHTHTRSLTGTLTYDAARSYAFSIHARLLLLLFTNIFILLFWLAKVTRPIFEVLLHLHVRIRLCTLHQSASPHASAASSSHSFRFRRFSIIIIYLRSRRYDLLGIRLPKALCRAPKNERTNLELMMATTHAHGIHNVHLTYLFRIIISSTAAADDNNDERWRRRYYGIAFSIRLRE